MVAAAFGTAIYSQVPKPVYTYLSDFSALNTATSSLKGPARVISFAGRKGLNMTNIKTVLEMKAHTVRRPQGTVSIWFMPLEEMSTFDAKPSFSTSNPDFYTYAFLSDNPNPQDYNTAAFKLAWTPRYVWSNKPFEGNLYVEYEFKVLRPGALSLLMVQASGMNREDFMADYPLRKSGRMTTVYGEDVRNYHWEYYREMADMRNDVENSALMKNPFLYPLSFNALSTPVDKTKWHKLQFLQVGNKLIGAINGTKMVEFTDDGFSNNGPVYNFGRIAIRCMLHSKLAFRNLRVYNKATVKTEKIFP